MTTASDILHTTRSAGDAMERAAQAGAETDQDWNREATLYRFPDGSVLLVSGTQRNAYPDEQSAREQLTG